MTVDLPAVSMQVELLPIDSLLPHEQVIEKKVVQLLEVTLKWGCYTKPVIVDGKSGVLLDGHHRHQVGLRLGLRRLPAVVVDYLDDDDITVSLWPASELESISKQDVLAMGLSDEVYPPKTSRHTFADHLPPISVTLEQLREEND